MGKQTLRGCVPSPLKTSLVKKILNVITRNCGKLYLPQNDFRFNVFTVNFNLFLFSGSTFGKHSCNGLFSKAKLVQGNFIPPSVLIYVSAAHMKHKSHHCKHIEAKGGWLLRTEQADESSEPRSFFPHTCSLIRLIEFDFEISLKNGGRTTYKQV